MSDTRDYIGNELKNLFSITLIDSTLSNQDTLYALKLISAKDVFESNTELQKFIKFLRYFDSDYSGDFHSWVDDKTILFKNLIKIKKDKFEKATFIVNMPNTKLNKLNYSFNLNNSNEFHFKISNSLLEIFKYNKTYTKSEASEFFVFNSLLGGELKFDTFLNLSRSLNSVECKNFKKNKDTHDSISVISKSVLEKTLFELPLLPKKVELNWELSSPQDIRKLLEMASNYPNNCLAYHIAYISKNFINDISLISELFFVVNFDTKRVKDANIDLDRLARALIFMKENNEVDVQLHIIYGLV